MANFHLISWRKQSGGLSGSNFIHPENNRSEYADGFYNSMIDDKDGHIPSLLIMFTWTALRRALLEWQKNNGIHLKASK